MNHVKIRWQTIVKVLIFVLGFILIFVVCSAIVKPKWMFQTEEKSPETEIWTEFYDEPRNTLDILYVGSSHVYDDINPVVVYEKTGLRGFDLASSRQDMATSYFYVKEALRRQKPEYVILETYGFRYDALSSEEYACYKRSLDYIKGISVKIEAYQAWHENLPGESFVSRFFTIMDYHSRWDSLGEIDFSYKKKIETVNGYSPVYTSKTVSHEDYYVNEKIDEISEATRIYFDKLYTLCQENGIQIVLCSTPAQNARKTQADQIRTIAEGYQIPFYDFNDDSYYAEIGLDHTKDYRDYSHLNVHGAEKFSLFLGEQISEWFSLEENGKADESWDQKVEKWENEKTIGILANINNLQEYLEYVKKDDFIVMINTEGEFTKNLDEELLRAFEHLGCQKIRSAGKKASYLAVVRNGNCYYEDKRGDKSLRYETEIDGMTLKMYSAGKNSGNDSYCIVNDQEVSVSKNGINIEVYSVHMGKIVDAVNFDLSTGSEVCRLQ